jgi:hypothetical protein
MGQGGGVVERSLERRFEELAHIGKGAMALQLLLAEHLKNKHCYRAVGLSRL